MCSNCIWRASLCTMMETDWSEPASTAAHLIINFVRMTECRAYEAFTTKTALHLLRWRRYGGDKTAMDRFWI